MLFGKMLVPIRAFHTNPFAAITAGKISNVLTTSKAETALIADALALRAIFLAIRADGRTLLTRAAVPAYQNTIRTQIAVLAEGFGAFKTAFPAPLAKR